MIVRLLVVLSVMVTAVSADARYRREGFALPTDRRVSIAVICPDLFIGSITSDNQRAIDEEWTRNGFANLRAELAAHEMSRVIDFQYSDCDPAAERTPLHTQFRATLNMLVMDVGNKVPPGTFPLPDNNMRLLRGIPRGEFHYSVGHDLARQLREGTNNADFALYFQIYDTYSTRNRIVGRVLGAFIGIPVVSPPHYANTFLIDLRDGGLVWMHNDGAVVGDLRQRETSRRRFDDVMRRFPGFELVPRRR